MDEAPAQTLRFLEDLTLRPWQADSRDIIPFGLFIGSGRDVGSTCWLKKRDMIDERDTVVAHAAWDYEARLDGVRRYLRP